MSDLLVVDANNLAHKCRHVFQLTTPAGVDCSVTYGVLSVLKSYISKFNTAAVVLCWDGGLPSHRLARHPEYKANRVKGDEIEYKNFLRQVQEISKILADAFGVFSIRSPHVEADDLMYHTAVLTHENYDRVILISSDMDVYQAVNISNNVFIYNPEKDDLRQAQYLQETYDINPKDYVHWRALQGDGSDNIDGVPGIGPKTASKLFQTYKSLSGIINAAHGDNPIGTITGKIGENIVAFGSQNLTRNVFVMALTFDRAGARRALLTGLENYKWGEVKRIKQYLMSQSFTSMMDAGVYKLFCSLEKPELDDSVRIPVVVHKRVAI